MTNVPDLSKEAAHPPRGREERNDMKRAIACLLCVSLLCSALPGCAPVGEEPPVSTASAPAESEPPAATPSAPAESEPPAAGTLPPASTEPWDYSDHDDPNEAWYVTKLIDLDALGDGKAHLALQMDADVWDWEFTGMVKEDIVGYDLRSMDAREADLSVVEDWNEVTFNTDTLWPDPLPEGFSPEEILEFNKNPGLSVRDLHRQGFTGKGVGVAIIDQGLYTGHEEYAQNLKTYELIHCSDPVSSMHGPAVSSIAVGRTVGVAPEADLYYIGSTFGHRTSGGFDFDAAIMADCVLRVCEMNEHLPPEGKIRVISISRGYAGTDPGCEELQDAIRQAGEQGILVLTTSTRMAYPFKLFGLSRGYFDDPDDPASYRPMSWDPTGDYSAPNIVCVPMGSRTCAACTGPHDYEINYEGGLSWAVPWLAGFYALCCQAKPEITPSEFIELITNTTQTFAPPSGGLVNVIDPGAVIARLTG